MKMSQAFPTKFLSEADLRDGNGEPTSFNLVVSRVVMETLDTDSNDSKPVVYFSNAQKGLVLNKTNANNIAVFLGDETDTWTGQSIEVYPATTDFQGRTVACIRVRAPQAGAAPAPVTPAPAPVVADLDDTIPF